LASHSGSADQINEVGLILRGYLGVLDGTNSSLIRYYSDKVHGLHSKVTMGKLSNLSASLLICKMGTLTLSSIGLFQGFDEIIKALTAGLVWKKW